MRRSTRYSFACIKYGVNVKEVSADLGKIIARKTKVVRKLVLGIKAKLTAQKVTLVQGEATFRMHILFVAVRSCMNVNR